MNNLVSKNRAAELEKHGPIATLTLSNWGGLAVYEIDPCGETLVMRAEFGQDRPAPLRWYTIKRNFDGSPFVEYGRHRYYLNEFMRCNR